MKLVSIIDYGCGNIKSVFNAFSAIHEKNNLCIQITSKENEIKKFQPYSAAWGRSYESCVEGLKFKFVGYSFQESIRRSSPLFRNLMWNANVILSRI